MVQDERAGEFNLRNVSRQSNIFSSVCRQYEAEFQHDVWLAGWLVAGWEGATKSAALHEKDRIEWNIVLN